MLIRNRPSRKKERGASLVLVMSLIFIFSVLVLAEIKDAVIKEKDAVEQTIFNKAYVSSESGMTLANSDLSRISLINNPTDVCTPEDDVSAMFSLQNNQFTSYCFQKESSGTFNAKSYGTFYSSSNILSNVLTESIFSMGFENLSAINIVDNGIFDVNLNKNVNTDNTNIMVIGNMKSESLGPSVSSINSNNLQNIINAPNVFDATFVGKEDTPSYPHVGQLSFSSEVNANSLRDTETFSELVNILEQEADVTMSPGNIGGMTLGNSVTPQITYIDGNATALSVFSGSGILVVNGNATFEDGYFFDGIIIVNGNYSNSVVSSSVECRGTPPGQGGGGPPGQGGGGGGNGPPGQGGTPPGQQRGDCLTDAGQNRLDFLLEQDVVNDILNDTYFCENNQYNFIGNSISFNGKNEIFNICQTDTTNIAYTSMLNGSLIVNSDTPANISLESRSENECGIVGEDSDIPCAQLLYIQEKDDLNDIYSILSEDVRSEWETFFDFKTLDIDIL